MPVRELSPPFVPRPLVTTELSLKDTRVEASRLVKTSRTEQSLNGADECQVEEDTWCVLEFDEREMRSGEDHSDYGLRGPQEFMSTEKSSVSTNSYSPLTELVVMVQRMTLEATSPVTVSN